MGKDGIMMGDGTSVSKSPEAVVDIYGWSVADRLLLSQTK